VIARGVPHTPKMNGTESGYAILLEAEKRMGKVREYHFEGISLALGNGARYTPDFLVVRDDWTCELHEVKGFMREAALVRLKVCARMYPFRVLVVRKTASGFERTPVAP
jgi:hypothetical protein